MAKAYLILYNSVMALGWLYILCVSINSFTRLTIGPESLRSQTFKKTGLYYNLSVFVSVSSRLFITWIIVHDHPESAQKSMGLGFLLLAWSLSDSVRHMYYLCGLLHINIPGITIARYTLFLFLYPLGVTGELLCTYAVTQEKSGSNSIYKYALYAIMCLYLPLFPQMYIHMLKQRKKVLGGGGRPSNESKQSGDGEKKAN